MSLATEEIGAGPWWETPLFRNSLDVSLHIAHDVLRNSLDWPWGFSVAFEHE